MSIYGGSTVASHNRVLGSVLELDIDRCQRSYGEGGLGCRAVLPGPGLQCYKTNGSCQDKERYLRGTTTHKFCLRGMETPAGETLRPYVKSVEAVITEIDPDKGLATRGQLTITLIDEPCDDFGLDPYASERVLPVGGTFWTRLIARNPNYAGRFARIKRGLVTEPWDWGTFQTELYIIDRITGPNQKGEVKVVLKDAVALLDKAKLPALSDGKLIEEIKGAAHIGVANGGGPTSIILSTEASSTDGEYNGFEVYIDQNTGAGQRRTITGYTGATRVAVVSPAFLVDPDITSVYELVPLKLEVQEGKGLQYPDPVVTGKPEYVRIGDEIIQYTAILEDALIWTDGTYRAKFGTKRDDHSKDALVQTCKVWIDIAPATVIKELLNSANIANDKINTAELGAVCNRWLSVGANITCCLSAPEQVSTLYSELLRHLNLSSWWQAVEQTVKFIANMPEFPAGNIPLTDNELILDSIKVERLDAERLTATALYYDMNSATADPAQAKSYSKASVALDSDAENPNEYGDSRVGVIRSRWLSADNAVMANALNQRRLLRNRDVNTKLTFNLDPRNPVAAGDLCDITTWRITDETGTIKTQTFRVVKASDMSTHLEVEAKTVGFGGRFCWIAPDDQADYGAASDAEKLYGYISPAGGLNFTDDGSKPYLII